MLDYPLMAERMQNWQGEEKQERVFGNWPKRTKKGGEGRRLHVRGDQYSDIIKEGKKPLKYPNNNFNSFEGRICSYESEETVANAVGNLLEKKPGTEVRVESKGWNASMINQIPEARYAASSRLLSSFADRNEANDESQSL